ncbi:MAG TPA: 3'-5' exonuclease, partial [Acidimicrobiales bacterium]|nr:3'-5' exonuclease [Acidimicrobiales bacterium]
HILVDEFQDTNHAQNEIVRLLGESHGNVTVVGDSDQSVYRWRGADIRNILEFERDFPNATTIVLEQNFRSTQTILDAANAVISNNPGRPVKNLFTAGEAGELVSRYRGEDERDEAAWVSSEILRLRAAEHLQWRDIAVFYRTNAQSRALEDSFIFTGIPYKVVGGAKFYDRREVKDILAYIRVLANPEDEVSARRIVNVPKRGIGDSSVARLAAWAQTHKVSFTEAVERAEEAGVSGKALKGAARLAATLDELRPMVATVNPADFVQLVAERTGYLAELVAEHTHEADGRIENIAELASVASEFDDVIGFLETVALVADTDELESDGTKVSLMTLHTAKGLEFPAVFVVGLEDGVFPHMRSIGEPAELEEERRLFYVGITRAQRHLAISHAWVRTMWGRTQHNIPSRFLAEVPSELVREVGLVTSREERDLSTALRPGHAFAAADDMPAGRRSPAVRGSTGAEDLGIVAGDAVVHDHWGPGIVLDTKGEGARAQATVDFASVGKKSLLLSATPLRRA